MSNIIITLPQSVKWDQYENELLMVADGKAVMNFKIPSLPKHSRSGDRCYLAYKGRVVGWMKIVGFVTRDAFTCSTTGNYWPAGHYVQRSGLFRLMESTVEQKGFQGWRYYTGPLE